MKQSFRGRSWFRWFQFTLIIGVLFSFINGSLNNDAWAKAARNCTRPTDVIGSLKAIKKRQEKSRDKANERAREKEVGQDRPEHREILENQERSRERNDKARARSEICHLLLKGRQAVTIKDAIPVRGYQGLYVLKHLFPGRDFVTVEDIMASGKTFQHEIDSAIDYARMISRGPDRESLVLVTEDEMGNTPGFDGLVVDRHGMPRAAFSLKTTKSSVYGMAHKAVEKARKFSLLKEWVDHFNFFSISEKKRIALALASLWRYTDLFFFDGNSQNVPHVRVGIDITDLTSVRRRLTVDSLNQDYEFASLRNDLRELADIMYFEIDYYSDGQLLLRYTTDDAQ